MAQRLPVVAGGETDMDDATLTARLEAVREQQYPLTLTSDDAEALVECINRIMSAFPEEQRIFLRADYDLATSALSHPKPSDSWSPDQSEHFQFRWP